jgi:hypothetical protein
MPWFVYFSISSNNSSTLISKNLAILIAKTVEGTNLPFSIVLMVFLVTPILAASSS